MSIAPATRTNQRHNAGLWDEGLPHDNVMWGADHPPLRRDLAASHEVVEVGIRRLACRRGPRHVGAIPPRVYGFDLAQSVPIAGRIGPTYAELSAEPDERLWEW